jgi:hypothetical protein
VKFLSYVAESQVHPVTQAVQGLILPALIIIETSFQHTLVLQRDFQQPKFLQRVADAQKLLCNVTCDRKPAILRGLVSSIGGKVSLQY